MLKINVPDSADSVVRVPLNGVSYKFHFTYNSTTSAYYLRVSDMDNEVVVPTIKLVSGVDLTRKYSHLGFNQGSLIVVKVRETSETPNRFNIGNDKPYLLVYFSNDEVSPNG